MRAVRVWFRVIACRNTSVAREVRQVRQKQCGGKVSKCNAVNFLPVAIRACTVLIDEVEIREYDTRQRTALGTDDEARNLALDPETGDVTEN